MTEVITARHRVAYIRAFSSVPESPLNIGDMVCVRGDVGTMYEVFLVDGGIARIGYGDVRKEVAIADIRLLPPVMQAYSDLLQLGFFNITQKGLGLVRGHTIKVE